MIYAISDIHGCYDLYTELLNKINFSDSDRLYILGDSMDRGAEPIKVMLDIMSRKNITYIMGNHEYMALRLFTKLADYSRDNILKILAFEDLKDYLLWRDNGGDITLIQYMRLDIDTRLRIMEYIQKASKFEIVDTASTKYILAHAGIENIISITSISELNELPVESFIFERPDYSKKILKKEFNLKLVVGHTPTLLINNKSKIYKTDDYLVIDCGAVFGGCLSAFCLDSGEEFYVD